MTAIAAEAPVTTKAGPKTARVMTPLDLSALPAKRDYRRVIAFAEAFLVVPAGKNARQPVKLLRWEKDVLRGLFPASGKRPAQGLVVCGRGNGKSFLASVVLAYLLFADDIESPQLSCVAREIRQATIVAGALRRMIELSPELLCRTKLHTDGRIVTPFNNGIVQPLPSNEDSLQGWAGTVVVDELATVDHAIWESCAMSASKIPESQVLAFSTPPSRADSVMWRLVEKAKADPDPSFYFKEFTSDPLHPIDCHHCEKAANPSLGHLLTRDMLAASRKVSRESEYRRLRLAQTVEKTEDAWLGRSEVEAVLTDEPIPWKTRVVIGFDGSYSGDCTVLVAATVDTAPRVELLAAWVPDDHADGYRVDIEDVEDTIRLMAQRYEVVEIACDPARWARSLQILAKEGLPMVEHPQSDARLGGPTVQVYEAIANEKISFVRNEILQSHLLNAHVTETMRGAKIHKRDSKSKDRIDAAVAAVMAVGRATFYASKTQPKRRVFRSVS